MAQILDPQATLRTDIILAIFDIDKTFLHGDSFGRFCWFAIRRGGISLRWLGRFALGAVMHPTCLLDAGHLKKSCLRICLATCDRGSLTTLVQEFIDSVLFKRVRLAAADRLRWHKQQNHTIMFLSASPDLYLNDLGTRFGVDRVVCTKFLNSEDQFTGELFSVNCKGNEKRRRLLEAYSATEIAWSRSYGYGDSVDDVGFLALLGNPVAVNPDAKLRKFAAKRKWPIESWR